MSTLQDRVDAAIKLKMQTASPEELASLPLQELLKLREAQPASKPKQIKTAEVKEYSSLDSRQLRRVVGKTCRNFYPIARRTEYQEIFEVDITDVEFLARFQQVAKEMYPKAVVSDIPRQVELDIRRRVRAHGNKGQVTNLKWNDPAKRTVLTYINFTGSHKDPDLSPSQAAQ